MRRTILPALLTSLVLAACGTSGVAPCAPPPSELRFTGHDRTVALHVEVASTPRARAHGLMGREQLPEDHGMAFVFAQSSTDRFWMKDTTIPLSIAFWDERGRVVAILDMDPCTSSPCPTYGASVPFVGAVEANRGYFAEHGVQVGDRVKLIGGGCV